MVILKKLRAEFSLLPKKKTPTFISYYSEGSLKQLV